MAYKLEVTDCTDCPLNQYMGGPEICFLTKKSTKTGDAWNSCPLKGNKTVEIRLSKKEEK